MDSHNAGKSKTACVSLASQCWIDSLSRQLAEKYDFEVPRSQVKLPWYPNIVHFSFILCMCSVLCKENKQCLICDKSGC